MPAPARPGPTPEESAPLLLHAYNGLFNELVAAAAPLAAAKGLGLNLLLVLAKDAQGRGIAHHAARRDHANNRVVVVRALSLFAREEPGLARAFLSARDNNGDTPLHYAAGQGHPAMVLLLLQGGASPNALNKARQTVLHVAVMRGEMVTLGHLLADRWGLWLNACDTTGRPALHFATLRGDVQVVAALVTARHADDAAAAALRPETAPASLTLLDNFHNSVLHEAVRSRNPVLVAQLAARGAPVNIQNRLGSTPLHVATTLGDLDAADHLLASCQANGNLRDRRGRTPRDLAAQGGFDELVMLLRHYGF